MQAQIIESRWTMPGVIILVILSVIVRRLGEHVEWDIDPCRVRRARAGDRRSRKTVANSPDRQPEHGGHDADQCPT